MFGYIKPYTPELKVKEHELYKAAYCGLCKTMKKLRLSTMRTVLSYDGVFLALVRCSLDGTKIETYRGRCGANVFKTRTIAKPNRHLEYAACACTALAYYKVLDDIADKKGPVTLLLKMALPHLRAQLRRAEKIYPIPKEEIASALERLGELERASCSSLDLLCDVNGDMLGAVFASGMEENRDAAEDIGRNTGRFVYATDVYDDVYDDEKSGAFNPLLLGEGPLAERLKACRDCASVYADRVFGEITLSGKDGAVSDICANVASLGMIAAFESKGKSRSK